MASAGDNVWVAGFGGVKIDGAARAAWPARVVDVATISDAKVQKAAKPGAVLVRSFGDAKFIWAKPQALKPFDAESASAALHRASARVAPAIRQALQAAGKKKAPILKRSRDEEEDDGLSPYERQRLETMRANQAVLESLGILDASAALRQGLSTPEKPPIDPAVRAARAAERAARLAEATARRRTSSRLADGGDKAPVRYSQEYAALDEAETPAVSRVKQQRRLDLGERGGGRGRRGRGASHVSALSAEERAVVAAAYEEAAGWLEAMKRYFAAKLSEANLRNVMKVATALATGEGVAHTRRSDVFRLGQPVTLEEDLVALRVAANRFLLPEDDPGHGWRLDHPIGKMAIFQAHLHATRS